MGIHGYPDPGSSVSLEHQIPIPVNLGSFLLKYFMPLILLRCCEVIMEYFINDKAPLPMGLRMVTAELQLEEKQ